MSERGVVLRSLPLSSPHHAATAPRSAVAELGVVRRIVPSPDNHQVMSLPKLATHSEFARRSLAACAASVGSLSASGFGGCATLSVLSNTFRSLTILKPQAAQPCGLCHTLSTSGHRRLRPRRPFPNSTRTPNHALQRTATGCHGSCFSRSGVSRSSRIATSLGAFSAAHLRSYRASPPRSLSLRSFGDSSRSPQSKS